MQPEFADEGRDPFGPSVVEHALHDRRTDDNAVGHLRDLNRLLRGADTDADEYRLVGDALQTPGDLDRRCRKGGANAGDTEQTDAVDEASRSLDNQGQPFVGRRRRRQHDGLDTGLIGR